MLELAAPEPRARVAIENRADGGLAYWLAKLYGFATLAGLALGALGAGLLYTYFSINTPTTRDLRAYPHAVPSVSRIYAADGTLLGEFAKEWREFVPYEQIPQQLVDAFLSVEDHDFWNHGGIYFKGIARAVWANVTARDFAQGGSTITQQVAKQFLGAEKSLSRKAKEAITARRLEASYSKKAILSVYLNQIYLGAGAWGVAAAARRYFQKDLKDLTLAECALIAGLAKAPTAYSPVTNPKKALERRNSVLDKMAGYGVATADDIGKAKAEPIKLNLYRDVFPDRMPYYAEQVRRYVTEHYGNDALFSSGYASRPRPSRRGNPRHTRMPTMARAIRTSAKAGAVPSGGSTAPHARRSSSARSSCTVPARSCRTSATSRSSTRSMASTPSC